MTDPHVLIAGIGAAELAPLLAINNLHAHETPSLDAERFEQFMYVDRVIAGISFDAWFLNFWNSAAGGRQNR